MLSVSMHCYTPRPQYCNFYFLWTVSCFDQRIIPRAHERWLVLQLHSCLPAVDNRLASQMIPARQRQKPSFTKSQVFNGRSNLTSFKLKSRTPCQSITSATSCMPSNSSRFWARQGNVARRLHEQLDGLARSYALTFGKPEYWFEPWDSERRILAIT